MTRYILGHPFSPEKMTYQQQGRTVGYRSKVNPVLKKNLSIFSQELDGDGDAKTFYG